MRYVQYLQVVMGHAAYLSTCTYLGKCCSLCIMADFIATDIYNLKVIFANQMRIYNESSSPLNPTNHNIDELILFWFLSGSLRPAVSHFIPLSRNPPEFDLDSRLTILFNFS